MEDNKASQPEQETQENDHPKVEESEPKKKAPEKPKEPEPEIPSNLDNEIAELTKIKTEGNNLIGTDLPTACSKYEEGFNKSKEFMQKFNKERTYNPKVLEWETIKKQIMSNLAWCYFKQERYKDCCEMDILIIAIDRNYDKSYARWFKSYLKLNNPETACYFGNILKNGFNDETREKYKDLIVQIDEESKKIESKISEIRRKERNQMIKSIAKYAVPLLVLIGAGLYYFFFIRKKKENIDTKLED